MPYLSPFFFLFYHSPRLILFFQSYILTLYFCHTFHLDYPFLTIFALSPLIPPYLFPLIYLSLCCLFFPPYISPMLSLLYLSNRLIPALLLQSFCLIFNLALSISNYSRLIFLTFYLLPPYPDTSCLTFQPFISASYFISHYTFLTIPTLSLFFSPYHFPTALFLVRPYSCSSRIILVFTDLSLSIH